MRRRTGVAALWAVLLCGFLPAVSYSQQITIGLTGKIIRADDPCNFFGGQIQLNDTITGIYSYDTLCLDSNPDPAVGDYWHYTAPYGMSVNIGTFVFETNSNDVRFLVEIVNDQSGDSYLIRSWNSICSNGVLVDMIDWALGDYSSTALSSDALPTTAPNLANWDMDYGLTITGSVGPCLEYIIRADVTSVVLIPEPATIFILGLGYFLIKKRG
jgi:hypothetical protein